MNLASAVIKPMHPEGRKFVAAFTAATIVLWLIWAPLFWIGLVLTIWCYYFFRDPVRIVPLRDGLVVSPADGVVSLIQPAVPPAELGMEAKPLTRVSIFMNVFNCHVNRAPVPGTVGAVAYRPGKFLNASLDKASEDNERMSLRLDMVDGQALAVVQIAGLVARRIVCFVDRGRRLDVGERFGLIRFGSRVDVYLPDGVVPLVGLGQTMVAGETVLADLTGPAQSPGLRRD